MANFSEFNWNENENKKTANNGDRGEKQKLEEAKVATVEVKKLETKVDKIETKVDKTDARTDKHPKQDDQAPIEEPLTDEKQEQ